MAKIIYFSHKKINAKGFRSGPAQRVLEVCLALKKKGHDVEIAEQAHLHNYEINGINIINWTPELLTNIEKKYDVAIIHIWDNQPEFLDAISEIPVAVDIYAPIMIEEANYHYMLEKTNENTVSEYFNETILSNTRVFETGDFFFCANERQYFYYMGLLNVLGRLNPATYNQKIIGIVETCPQLEDEKPTKKILSESYNLENKKVFVWMSGIFPWYDTEIVLKAMKEIQEERDDIITIFVGPNNPQTKQGLLKPYYKTLYLAKELNVYNKSVYFHDFVKQNDRINVYSEATAAIITFQKNFEATLCSRSRTIDCLWGRLPIISTNVDYIADKIEKENLGITIDPSDANALKNAIITLADNESKNKEIRNNIDNLIKTKYNWNIAINSLDEFCKNPFIDKNKKLVSVYGMIQDKNRLMFNLRNDLQVRLAEITRRDTTIENMNKVIHDRDVSIEKTKEIIDQKEKEINEIKSSKEHQIQSMQEIIDQLEGTRIKLEKDLHQKGVEEGIKIEELRDYYNQKVYELNEIIVELNTKQR